MVSGVIDNSEKGKTLAELVIDGVGAPVVLELHGNAGPDLAGCILKFRCPRSWPVEGEVSGYLPEETRIGNVGVITAILKTIKSSGFWKVAATTRWRIPGRRSQY